MTNDDHGSLPKKYYRLTDLATRWNLEVSELMNYAVEGVILVAIEEFHVTCCDDGDEEAGEESGYPCWAAFLVPDALKKIALYGEVTIAGGLRMTPYGFRAISFPKRQVTIGDLIILPQVLNEISPQLDTETNGVGSPMSLAGRVTLLKQIAGLALVIHKQAQGSKFGGKSPNKSQIAKAVLATLDELPKDIYATLNLKGIGDGSIRQNIAKGMQHLGFADKDLSS